MNDNMLDGAIVVSRRNSRVFDVSLYSMRMTMLWSGDWVTSSGARNTSYPVRCPIFMFNTDCVAQPPMGSRNITTHATAYSRTSTFPARRRQPLFIYRFLNARVEFRRTCEPSRIRWHLVGCICLHRSGSPQMRMTQRIHEDHSLDWECHDVNGQGHGSKRVQIPTCVIRIL
jgi:hypothetical protein